MRLWEKRLIIWKVVNEGQVMQINAVNIYWWQWRRVTNFVQLSKAIWVLLEEERLKWDYENILNLIDEFSGKDTIEIDAKKYAELTWFINIVNPKLPIYLSILESVVPDQEAQVINIKLPDDWLESFKSLAEYNKRLDKVLWLFNVDWQFEFKWVERWSVWYEVITNWEGSFAAILIWIKVIKEIFSTAKEYYTSRKAKLDYQASLKNVEDYTEAKFSSYTTRRIALEIEHLVKDEIKLVWLESSKAPKELQNQLIKATNALLKEVEEGSEFHLSLNPPAYAEELEDKLEVDYEKFQELSIWMKKVKSITQKKKESEK